MTDTTPMQTYVDAIVECEGDQTSALDSISARYDELTPSQKRAILDSICRLRPKLDVMKEKLENDPDTAPPDPDTN